ncbi:MAG: VOC family protein [Acetobacteraceae bacterium]|nr:VOC family protein [Acetobacteraceae bacterium]
MTEPATNHAAQRMHSLSPHLVCAGAADAIEFYRRAFGAEELIRLPGPDGKLMHACVRINGSSVMLVDENPSFGLLGPKSLHGTPVTMHLIVADADQVVAQAAGAGAMVVMPVTDMFWGDRYGIVEDLFGHRWSVATPQRTLTAAEMQGAARAAMCGETVAA